MAKQLCRKCNLRPKYGTRHSCAWCWIAEQPIELQEAWAAYRLSKAQERPEYTYRARVPERDWEPGTRWCSGCQWMVPTTYTDGSRCRACASKARHRSYVERTYEITGEEYDALLAWQGGRCYVCGEMPRSVRLAVDHDHETNAVRGLLCAGQEQGCNYLLRKILGRPDAARRAAEYAEKPPLQRMRDGEPGRVEPKQDRQAVIRRAVLGVM
jgi:hypothetical protein